MSTQSRILSVGIDIGTSTTQVIFSRLVLTDSAGYFSIPHIEIAGREVIYQSEIINTPLKSRYLIDTDAIRLFIGHEYDRAGFDRKAVDTGAVIITGEAARKENADAVLRELSDLCGDFVVSTAGPDLEALIAGKGSGACAYSEDCHCRVINVDVGGGTANAVVFDCGKAVSCGCLDIGGRQITYDRDGVIDHISPGAQKIAEHYGIGLKTGAAADFGCLQDMAREMALLLRHWIEGEADPLLDVIRTASSSRLHPGKADAVFFSGGVGLWTQQESEDRTLFGDIGILLGEAIRETAADRGYAVCAAPETIRATVIGAGSHTTSVSGSTISYSRDLFPLKNIPVLRLTQEDEDACFGGIYEPLKRRIEWMRHQADRELIAVSLKGRVSPSYAEMKKLAYALSKAIPRSADDALPFVIILEEDIAKALGVCLKNLPDAAGRDLVCIDAVRAMDHDYVDLGHPMMDGLVIPVVVKTLITGNG